jgi:conjugal transfer/entry exclusion protein
MTDLTLDALRIELAPIQQRLDTMQPRVDGIPVLATAIEILQRDVRNLRDDMRVTSAMVQRADGTLSDLLQGARLIVGNAGAFQAIDVGQSIATKRDITALRSDLQVDLKSLETRLTIRMGAMTAALFALLVAIKYFG